MQSTLTANVLSNDRTTSIRDHIRLRALERLYARRAAVDALIDSLEDYAETRRVNRAKCIPIPLSVERKCS